jgi:hypothetical protein
LNDDGSDRALMAIPSKMRRRSRTTADELIRLNRKLLAVAERARSQSQALLLTSAIERTQRCLSGVYREPVWALGMAQWVAGLRAHPPSGRGRPLDLPSHNLP